MTEKNLLQFGLGLVLTGSTAEAMNLGRDNAGAASAVVGGVGYVAGGVVPPLVGLGDIARVSAALCVVFMFAGFHMSSRICCLLVFIL